MKNYDLMSFLRSLLVASAIVINVLSAGGMALASNYYVNSATGSDTNDGSISHPWQTLAKLNNAPFLPGDIISFACGGSWSGGFVASASGTSTNPIIYHSYGTGNKPSFTNTDPTVMHANVFHITGQYNVVDGLYFASCANNPTYKDYDGNTVQWGAIWTDSTASHATVKNCEIYDCPVGIFINGDHSLVTHNYLHDCNRFLNNPMWGPIGIFIANAYCEISYNTCVNYIHVGGAYGADGGFMELDNRFNGAVVHDMLVHNNKSIANEGFMECTAPDSSSTNPNDGIGQNNKIYYNLSDDFQQFVYFWDGKNDYVENNVIIRTRGSGGSTSNTVFTVTYDNGPIIVRNNIFVVAQGLQAWKGLPGADNFSTSTHQNNIYYCADGSVSDPVGTTLGTGEKVAYPGFVSYTLNSMSN